jgi:signal transduction histidine kinase
MHAAGVVTSVAVGRAVRVMGFESEALEARAAVLARQSDEMARAAVAEERARIARELHDVIGHSISVMGVQAGAVRRLLRPEQEREREVLLAVEQTGRDAVDEMRHLLGLLRSAGDDPRALPPTLMRLDDLVEDMRRAGLNIELMVEGDIGLLSPGRAVAAFRVLQEALTNVMKHAAGARVTARLSMSPAELRIEVVDDGGRGLRAEVPEGGGHGIIGMRERVSVYGGTLEARPCPGGGFAVVASVPTAGGS